MSAVSDNRRCVTFTENNNHEGETWETFIDLEGNEESLKILGDMLDLAEDRCGQNYYLCMNPLSREEARIVSKHSQGGYMQYQYYASGTLDIMGTHLNQEYLKLKEKLAEIPARNQRMTELESQMGELLESDPNYTTISNEYSKLEDEWTCREFLCDEWGENLFQYLYKGQITNYIGQC